MKKYLTFGTLLLALSGSAFAQGGYHWESRQDDSDGHGANVSSSNVTEARQMNHTAVEHKRYLFDIEPSPLALRKNMDLNHKMSGITRQGDQSASGNHVNGLGS
ncbi:hypothetical protein [Hahella ganghwensis]|uniref:hypothetical protein n=1 Tax=Hahella ganghwensis TaxID=286420 RepID=UPI00037D4656|nr:hypothetical protein [Hahella ganghwensis]